MIKIPPNGQFTQPNLGDNYGSLWSSFNLNLTEEKGKVKISPRTIITTNGITDLGCAVAFKVYGAHIYSLAGSYTWRTADTYAETAFAKTSLGSDPSACSSDVDDLEVFDSKLWATAGSKLFYTSGSTWAFYDSGGGTSGMTATAPHKFLPFLKTNRLYVTDSIPVIKSVAAGSTTLTSSGQYTFTLNSTMSDLLVTTMLQDPNYIWVLTINPTNQKAYVFTWDGITQDTPTNIYPLESRGALAGIIMNGTPYIIDTDAKLMYHNGASFILAPNGRLPVKFAKYLKNTLSSLNDRWIHPNGITLSNGRINILINNQNDDANATREENLPSGIWEYDPEIGWYHKNSLSTCLASNGTIIDYGQNRVSRVGALANIKPTNTTADTYIGTFLAGATYFSDASTTVNAIYTNDSTDTLQKSGYIVTAKILASKILESWNKIYAVHRKLLVASDRLVIKCRTSEMVPVDATVSWLTTSSFTTTSDLSSFAVGDEVEGTQGIGSGFTSHITAIQATSGGYMVSVDETYSGATGTSKVRFQKWIKCGTINDVKTIGSSIMVNGSAGIQGAWIQVKITMLFTGDGNLQQMLMINEPIQLT